MKSNFWGASFEAQPLGLTHVKLGNMPGMFSASRPSTWVQNFIVGTMYIEHIGEMVVRYDEPEDQNSSFNYDEIKELNITFVKAGWNKSMRYQIKGKIPVREGSDKFWIISGRWNDTIQAFNEETGETINVFEPKPYPNNKEWMYNFTKFAVNLNNCPDKLKDKLPPTDSRLRPDQLAHEQGDFDFATQEKLRLEEKQRTARKVLAESG